MRRMKGRRGDGVTGRNEERGNEEKDILPQRNMVYQGGKTRSFCFVLLCETQCNSVVNKK